MENSLKFVEKYTEDETHDTSEVETVRKRKVRSSYHWSLCKTFPTAVEAEEEVKNEGTWSKVSSYTTVEGEKVTYRCNQAKKELPCASNLYLMYHSESQKVKIKH